MKFLFKKMNRPKFFSIYITSDELLYIIPSSFNNQNWVVCADYFQAVSLTLIARMKL